MWEMLKGALPSWSEEVCISSEKGGGGGEEEGEEKKKGLLAGEQPFFGKHKAHFLLGPRGKSGCGLLKATSQSCNCVIRGEEEPQVPPGQAL